VKDCYKRKTSIELDTFIGMCYFHPYIDDAVKRISESGETYGRLYLFPLYPQYCFATSGIAFNRFFRAAEKYPLSAAAGEIVKIHDYHAHPLFIEASAKRVREAAGMLGKKAEEVHILFSAHSIPESLANKGDPYPKQIEACCGKITEAVKPGGASIGYQSRVGFARWLKPTSPEEIKRLSGVGVKDIAVYAVSFINDHIETLYDIDVDLAAFADGFGVRIARGAAFNSSDDFAAAAAEILINNG
jgi:ferrochelatase